MRLPQTDFARYAAEGEEAAFRAVVAGHLPMVLAVAQRRLGEHAHLASDVAQAVFTRLARVAKGLPPDMSVAAWLHRQAVRLAIDTVRKETRRRSRETTAALLNAPDISPAPPPWEHLAPLLDEALDRLSASDRAALVLRYLEDRDFAEVGKALGSTPEAARKRIARGLEKLRSLLAQRGVTLSISALAALLLANKSGAASAGLMATICNTALSSSSAGWKGSILLNLLRSNLTAVGAGAAFILVVALQLYKHQKREIDLRVLAETSTFPARLLPTGSAGSGPRQETGEGVSALSLDEIIAALRRITVGPDSRLAGLRTEALLNLVQPGQYGEFFTKGTASILQPRWKGIVDKASLRWRSRDPEALVKGLVEADNANLEVIRARIHPTGIYRLNTIETKWFANGEGKMELRLGTFDDWLQRDFEGAIRWLESQRDTPLMQLAMMDDTTYYETILRTAAAGMPASAPSSGLDRVAQASRNPAAFYRAAVVEKRNDSRALGEILTEVSDTAEIRAIICAAAQMKPEECFEWVRSCPPDSASRFEAALGIVAQQMRRTTEGSCAYMSPSERVTNAKFALDNAGPLPKAEALKAIVESWLAGRNNNDHKELLDWLSQIAPPEETKVALETGMRILAQKQFNLYAALDFAARMPDSADRHSLIRGFLLRMQDADPGQAAFFLRMAPPETTSVVKTLTSTDPP